MKNCVLRLVTGLFALAAGLKPAFALPLPSLTVERRAAGVFLEHPTQAGLLYQMESSSDGSAWEAAGPAHYGTGQGISALVYVPPPLPDDPNPGPPWNAPARWLSFFVTPVSTTQTVVGFISGGNFQRVLLTSSNFLSPNFRYRIAIRQDEGTPSNPSDDVILSCDFMMFGWSRDLLLLPRSDEGFPGLTLQQKEDLQRLIAASPALIAANAEAVANQVPAGPPLPPGPHRFYRLKISSLDSDGDGVLDSDEFIAGTNSYANPALNPSGSSATTANPTGLTWKPFWKRALPVVSIQQKWRRATFDIRESEPATGGAYTITRAGSVENYSAGSWRDTGLNASPVDRDLLRSNAQNEILKVWSAAPPLPLDPGGVTPEWASWNPTGNEPLYSRYRCEQTLQVAMIPYLKWGWKFNGEERRFRLTCATAAPEDLVRHFLKVKRYRRWAGQAASAPDWTYDPTAIATLTIPKGGTFSETFTLPLPFYAEEVPNSFYTFKTTEREEIFLPIEILSPTRQANGTLLAKSGGVRSLIYTPELRIAKLFPGKDTAGVSYFPIPEAAPNGIVPEADPDSFMIRVHDASGVWKQPADPTALPGIRITTQAPAAYVDTHSDIPNNPASNQMDATNPTMTSGWFSTKAMLLVSTPKDNEQVIYGATDGVRNDPSRLVLPGGTVSVTFPGWQRNTTSPGGGIASLSLPVPVAATATLDMKIFQDAFERNEAQHGSRFINHLRIVNEHFAQVGIVFTKRMGTPESPDIIPLSGEFSNSSLPLVYLTNLRPSPLYPKARGLLALSHRVTESGSSPLLSPGRSDNFLGVIFCDQQSPDGSGSSAATALTPYAIMPMETAYGGNLFMNYRISTTGGYDPLNTAHEIGHLLTNRGHFGNPESGVNPDLEVNYESSATVFEKELNLMTEGPWPLKPWPLIHQRLSEFQEALIFKNGTTWLRNPPATP